MFFETKEKDVLARLGKIKTKSGVVETPLLLPVINPAIQPVSPKEIRDEFGFEAVITNAYILRQHRKSKSAGQDVHKAIDFDGVIMTDSGAYQTLVYGGIEATQEEIVDYQELIGTDIATMLDVPTGWKSTEEQSSETVRETLARAVLLFKQITRDDILWVGPIQGGRHLKLVARSAKEMSKMPFDVHALGSPTEIMESYRFDVLVDMILTTKMNLHLNRPLHLFGAGHPLMFSLAVALGCDMFDSAAYALFARDGRYMTENGTYRLNELECFPCSCQACARTTPKRVKEMDVRDTKIFLTKHNLWACAAEMRRIKQAISDGRLWEHMEMRAHSHPSLHTAVKRIAKYKKFIEMHSPSFKSSGLFFYDSISLLRPEVSRHNKLFSDRYKPPGQAETLILIPQSSTKPFHNSVEYRRICETLGEEAAKAHFCFYAAPFGIVPIELDEVYPLSQHEMSMPPDEEIVRWMSVQIVTYVKRTNYRRMIFIESKRDWSYKMSEAVKKACKQRQIALKIVDIDMVYNKTEQRKDLTMKGRRQHSEQN